jgi:hypothetical protein
LNSAALDPVICNDTVNNDENDEPNAISNEPLNTDDDVSKVVVVG